MQEAEELAKLHSGSGSTKQGSGIHADSEGEGDGAANGQKDGNALRTQSDCRSNCSASRQSQ